MDTSSIKFNEGWTEAQQYVYNKMIEGDLCHETAVKAANLVVERSLNSDRAILRAVYSAQVLMLAFRWSSDGKSTNENYVYWNSIYKELSKRDKMIRLLFSET